LNEASRTVFVTLVISDADVPRARLLVESLRAFGGEMRDTRIWMFEGSPEKASCKDLEDERTRVIPLSVPESIRGYRFASKVYTCARAEEMAGPEVRSLVWISPDCLVLRPPVLFDLGPEFDAAVRPVHIRNVGLPAKDSVDGFWSRIYEETGVEDISSTVVSFVDQERIRAYFNSHALSVDPSRNLFRKWLEHFKSLVRDEEFQANACRDELHRIFLHQAVLSVLLATELDPERIRVLPPEYIYPYNLHSRVPEDRRADVLNDLVCIAYEDRSLHPDEVDDIRIDEPIRSWLSGRVEGIG
jgi:hypothetical protein